MKHLSMADEGTMQGLRYEPSSLGARIAFRQSQHIGLRGTGALVYDTSVTHCTILGIPIPFCYEPGATTDSGCPPSGAGIGVGLLLIVGVGLLAVRGLFR